MPVAEFERSLLRLLAGNRNPDSYVGGATILHQSPGSIRTSRDVDVFHDTLESLAISAEADIALLRTAGYAVESERPQETFRRAVVSRGGMQTKIEWVFDSAFRFFPVEADPELGWRLNFWDVAVNKVLALAGRSEVRDLVDVLELHARDLHLGALAWAGTGKDPGMTPEAILEWSGRNAVYRPEELAELILTHPTSLPELKQQWKVALTEARDLVGRLPPEEVGCLYLDAEGRPVCPDATAPGFPKLHRHFGSPRGAWPRIAKA